MKEGAMEIVWVIVTVIALAIVFVRLFRFGKGEPPSDLAPDPQGYGADLQARRKIYDDVTERFERLGFAAGKGLFTPARLGNVLYWIGCITATLIVGVATALYFNADSARGDDLPLVGFLILIAAIVWAIGAACRYVFAGR
jgi:ABC-type sugar transport system permease subunit